MKVLIIHAKRKKKTSAKKWKQTRKQLAETLERVRGEAPTPLTVEQASTQRLFTERARIWSGESDFKHLALRIELELLKRHKECTLPKNS